MRGCNILTLLRSLILVLLFSGSVFAQGIPPTQLKNEGTTLGPVFILDCVGSGIDCTRSGVTGTLTASGSGGSSDFTNAGWTDITTRVELVTSTDNVSVGHSVTGAKLDVRGDTDEVQIRVRGNSTQTATILRSETSTLAPLFTIETTGITAFVDFIAPGKIDDTDLANEDFGDVTCTSLEDGCTVDANAVALATDTTGNYVATVADAGNTTVTVSGSGSENAAVTIDAVDLNCTDCIGTTEIADSYVLNTGDTITGAFTIDGSADATQQIVEANATQTSRLAVWRRNNQNPYLAIDDTGITGGVSFIGVFSGNATTSTTAAALTANGADCSAGSAPIGVSAAGAAESCTDYEEDLSNSAGLLAALSDETGTGVAVFGTSPTIGTPTLTLQDGNGAAPTTDGQIKYDRTQEFVQVGTGTLTANFPQTYSKGVSLYNPNTAEKHSFQTPYPITITDVDAIMTGITGASMFLNECDSNGINCSPVTGSLVLTATETNVNATLTGNTSIDANDWVEVEVRSATGLGGRVSFTYDFTFN